MGFVIKVCEIQYVKFWAHVTAIVVWHFLIMDGDCGYCYQAIHNQDYLECIECEQYIHNKCLRRPGTPGDFFGYDILSIKIFYSTQSNESRLSSICLATAMYFLISNASIVPATG